MKRIHLSLFVLMLSLLLPVFSLKAQTSSELKPIDFSSVKKTGVQATGGNSWGGYAFSSSFPFYVRYSTEGLSPKGCTASDSTQSYNYPYKQIIAAPNIFIPRIIDSVGTGGTLGNLLQSFPAQGGYNIITCSDVTSPNTYRAIKWTDGLIGLPSQRTFEEEHFRYNAKKNTNGEVVILWDKTLNLKCDSIAGYNTSGKIVGNTHDFNAEQINTSGSLIIGYLPTETIFTTTCFNEENISAGQRTNLRAFITVPASPDPNPSLSTNTTPVTIVRTFKLPPNNACRTITFTKDLKQGDVDDEVLALENMIKGGFYALKDLPLSFETPNTYFDTKTTTFVSILQSLGGNFSGDGKVTALEREEFNKLPLCKNGAIGIYPQTTTIYDNTIAQAPTISTSTSTTTNTPTQVNPIRVSDTPISSISTNTQTKPSTTNSSKTTTQNTVSNSISPKISTNSSKTSNPVCRTVNFKSVLSYRSQGKEVVALQNMLKKLGYNIQNTGFFGKSTKSTVTKFQADNNIFPYNGIVGSSTLDFLNKYPVCTR